MLHQICKIACAGKVLMETVRIRHKSDCVFLLLSSPFHSPRICQSLAFAITISDHRHIVLQTAPNHWQHLVSLGAAYHILLAGHVTLLTSPSILQSASCLFHRRQSCSHTQLEREVVSWMQTLLHCKNTGRQLADVCISSTGSLVSFEQHMLLAHSYQ